MAKNKGRAPRRATLHMYWSKVIRERDDYTCQICFKNFRHDPGELEASHHIPRGMGGRNPFVACHLDNGSSKCRRCHERMDNNPLLHADWIRDFLGQERYDKLKWLAQDPPKMTAADKNDLKDYLRETLAALEARRRNGEMGRLEVESR